MLPQAPANLVTAILTEQENTLTTFVTLLVQEEQRQEEQKDKNAPARDQVVNETSCRP